MAADLIVVTQVRSAGWNATGRESSQLKSMQSQVGDPGPASTSVDYYTDDEGKRRM